MHYRGIPPHLWGGDRVTISPEVKKRLQQNIENELEYRKGSGEINIDFDNHSQLDDPKADKNIKKIADLVFVSVIGFMAGLWVGVIFSTISNT